MAKTLSDKRFHMGGTSGREWVIDDLDVKDTMKKIREELKNPKLSRFSVDEILDYHLGEKLKW